MLLKTVTLQSYTTLSTNGAHLPQSVYLPAHVWGSDGVPLLVGLHFLALLPQQAQLPITVMQPLGSGQRHMVTIHKLLSKNDQMIVSMLCYGRNIGNWANTFESSASWWITTNVLSIKDSLVRPFLITLIQCNWCLQWVHYGTYCMRGWLRGIHSRGKAKWCICLETLPWVHKIPWCAYTFSDPIFCWAKYSTLCTLWKSALLSYVYSSETANTWPYFAAGGWSKTSWGSLWG